MLAYLIAFLALFVPSVASAHEVYVLNSSQIASALSAKPFDMLSVIRENLGQFELWAFISILVVTSVFLISIVRFVERPLDAFFARVRRYAPVVSRVAVGLSFLAAAYYQASYGPELPIAATYGWLSPYITALMVVIGGCIIFGVLSRWAAVVAVGLYAVAAYFHGWYMLTYVNYLGEFALLIIAGAKHSEKAVEAGFAILRVTFGAALIYTSLYAKVIHNNLALDTIMTYHLDRFFHLEPHFIVLGASIVEVLLGLFFALGIEIRFASLFFEFWLCLSLWYFGEAVWPHLILIGIPIAFILYGYDKYSVEGFFFRKKQYKPAL